MMRLPNNILETRVKLKWKKHHPDGLVKKFFHYFFVKNISVLPIYQYSGNINQLCSGEISFAWNYSDKGFERIKVPSQIKSSVHFRFYIEEDYIIINEMDDLKNGNILFYIPGKHGIYYMKSMNKLVDQNPV